MNQSMQPDDTLIDLLVKQAVEGLSSQETAELDAAARMPDGQRLAVELNRFETAAAAVSLTGLDPRASLPPALRERLLRDAANAAAGLATQPVKVTAPGSGDTRSQASDLAARRSAAANSGWWAAAACLVLALFLVARGPRPAPTASAEQLRAALLTRADSIRISWAPTADPGGHGVSGDLVWNPASQSGVMRFVGMPGNDPAAHVYQLWIFDAERDERYPVDGGVFSVPAGAREVLVPIHATLPVHQAKLFAVTVEKPGGAVVSQREHIVVTASPG